MCNKIESYNAINELGLNKFAEGLFCANETDKVEEFLRSNPAQYYAIRDKSKPGGVFQLKVEEKDVMSAIAGYDIFSINVSSINYASNQLLVGEILITETDVNAILSTNSYYSVRDAIKNPSFNFVTNIFDNKTLDSVPYFDKVYEYIVRNKLKNLIVEFAYFDIPVGINKENIIIYELRTKY